MEETFGRAIYERERRKKKEETHSLYLRAHFRFIYIEVYICALLARPRSLGSTRPWRDTACVAWRHAQRSRDISRDGSKNRPDRNSHAHHASPTHYTHHHPLYSTQRCAISLMPRWGIFNTILCVYKLLPWRECNYFMIFFFRGVNSFYRFKDNVINEVLF